VVFGLIAINAIAFIYNGTLDPRIQNPLAGFELVPVELITGRDVGAIAGVLGAYLVLFPRARVISLVFLFYFIRITALPASVVLGFWIFLQIVNSLVLGSGMMPGGGVAYAAHIGGFAAGIIMIYLLGGKRLVRRRPVFYRRWRGR